MSGKTSIQRYNGKLDAREWRDALPRLDTRTVARERTATDVALGMDATTTFHTAADLSTTEATVRLGTRPGYVEVIFPARPTPAVLTELKAAGFRWALRSRCWYGLRDRLPTEYQEPVTA